VADNYLAGELQLPAVCLGGVRRRKFRSTLSPQFRDVNDKRFGIMIAFFCIAFYFYLFYFCIFNYISAIDQFWINPDDIL